MVNSADGKGRTLMEILTGKNKKDMSPLELQYHNPLKAKIGVSATFKHILDIPGIHFFINGIDVYETRISGRNFYHTDYVLKGQTLDAPKPLRYRLRVVPDEDNSLGYRLQLLNNYYQCGWTEAESMNLLDGVLKDQNGEFHINEDEAGIPYDEPAIFWRVGDTREQRNSEGNLIGDILDPYRSRVTTLKDVDGDGVVEEDELERRNISSWDYHRETTDEDTQKKVMEYLSIEFDESTRQFTFLRGRNIEPFQCELI